MSNTYAPTDDVLTIAGRIIPPSGQLGQERFRVEFPPSAVFADATDGSLIKMLVTAKSATLTINALQKDPATGTLLELAAEQARTGQAKVAWPGSGVLVDGSGTPRSVRWSDAWIEQQGALVSSGSVTITTWTLRLEQVVRA